MAYQIRPISYFDAYTIQKANQIFRLVTDAIDDLRMLGSDQSGQMKKREREYRLRNDILEACKSFQPEMQEQMDFFQKLATEAVNRSSMPQAMIFPRPENE